MTTDASDEARAAATVVLLRDDPGGIETLLLRRNSKIAFGGMWVFPGGRVDDGDRDPLAPDDELPAARRAAVRETHEEAGLVVDETALVTLSHWTPPPVAPKRYLTWFFLTETPTRTVTIDHGEIHAHEWMRPADALARRNALDIELAPPTWVTLEWLAGRPTVATALEAARNRAAERFETRLAFPEIGPIALWHGDAGYDTSDADVPGARHRLSMLADGWRYERHD